jgi:hypothetical protein
MGVQGLSRLSVRNLSKHGLVQMVAYEEGKKYEVLLILRTQRVSGWVFLKENSKDMIDYVLLKL